MGSLSLEELAGKRREREKMEKNAASENSRPAVKDREQGADGSGLDVSLTPEERKKVNAIKESLDLTDSQACIQYGTGAQRNISDFSESLCGSQ